MSGDIIPVDLSKKFRSVILDILKTCHYSRSALGRMLGIKRQQICRLLKREDYRMTVMQFLAILEVLKFMIAMKNLDENVVYNLFYDLTDIECDWHSLVILRNTITPFSEDERRVCDESFWEYG